MVVPGCAIRPRARQAAFVTTQTDSSPRVEGPGQRAAGTPAPPKAKLYAANILGEFPDGLKIFGWRSGIPREAVGEVLREHSMRLGGGLRVQQVRTRCLKRALFF